MEIKDIQLLISEISAIRNQYEKMAQESGENFNIFKILNLELKEIRHSAIICELLNPSGSHGQKDIFLKLFLDELKITDQQFQPQGAQVIKEKHLGFNTETEGGYIDILLTDIYNHQIIIENKICAEDQHNQLIRYHNSNKNATILYLTLYGSEPGNIDKKNHSYIYEKLKCISYKENIINWLYKCRKESTTHSILRETLTQYINLIKYLTGQSTITAMNKEIVEKLASSVENIEAAYLIESVMGELQNKILTDSIVELRKIGDRHELETLCNENWRLNETFGFYFCRSSWSNFVIGFEIDTYEKKGHLFYGLKNNSAIIDTNLFESIKRSLVSNVKEHELTNTWPYWRYFENGDWTQKSFYIDIKVGTFFKKVENIVKDILEKTKDMKL